MGRGHTEVTIFVPQWRKEPSRPETPIKDQEILFQLENAGYIKFTPSRRFGSRKIVCYDDRFIVQLACDKGGIIVSGDNFRDLFDENPSWRETIEKRVLQFVFVEDSFMVPQDPLGKHGPRLDTFLRFERGVSPHKEASSDQHMMIPKDKTPCPYKEKCTFGPRCRYYHPEREMKQREKEAAAQEDVPGVPPREDELTLKMNQLNLQTSPQKLIHTHPVSYVDPSSLDRSPGGLQNLRHTHPLVGPLSHHSNSSMVPKERESTIPFSHIPADQWGMARGREEHKVIGRGGPERHFEKLEVGGYHTSYATPPLTMSPSPYNPSTYQHSHYTRPSTHPHLVSPHLHPEYHHSRYSIQHPIHSNEFPAGVPTSRPHSTNMVGYTTAGGGNYSCYKDPRELDQIQALDGNQKLVYERAAEMYPQYRDRILALIIQFHISDINTLVKALGK